MSAPPRPPLGPTPLATVGLLLLLALAVLLFLPLLGLGHPPLWLIVTLLVARLAVQLLRARAEPAQRRPVGWLVDVVLIGLLIYVALGR